MPAALAGTAAAAAALIEVSVHNTSLCAAAGAHFSQFKMNPAPNKMLNQIY